MTAKTPASKKAKGNRAEMDVAKAYRHFGIDPKATRMPMSGAMTHFKGDIWKPDDYAYVDEVKNQEKINFWKWWEQAESQASSGRVPLLHITSNYRPILTVMKLETYMDLRKEIKDLEAIIAEMEKK
jgi:hypothetical protein